MSPGWSSRTGSESAEHRNTTDETRSPDYMDNVYAVNLDKKLSATVPSVTDPILRGLVLDSQCDYKSSNWSIRDEASAWDETDQRVLLHHTSDLHVRAHFPETIKQRNATRLQGDGSGAVLRYVATYAPNFSDSFASDCSIARRVLFDYHPLEPEMWLHLAGMLFPQISFGVTLAPIVAPLPLAEEQPGFVKRYE